MAEPIIGKTMPNSLTLSVRPRKNWVDALRAIAIILVVYGHCVKNLPGFFVFTSPVKMPLFFAISGYVFNMREGNQKLFWKNWFLKLIIPWFCLALIPFAPKMIMGRASLGRYLLELVSGEVLWFMPCFVVAEVIHFYIRKIGKNEWAITAMSILTCVIGFVTHRMGLLNFAMLNRALVVQSFFLIGYLFKNHEMKLVQLPLFVLVLWFFVYLALGVLSTFAFPGQSLDVHLNRYYHFFLNFGMIYAGCFWLFTVFSKLKVNSSILSFIGQNTLVIYIWHSYAIAVLSFALSLFGLSLGFSWWEALVCVIWACAFCGLCATLINKYFPELVGKKRLK